MNDARALFFDECAAQVRSSRQQAEGALSQVSDQQFFSIPTQGENSMAILVKHLGGNLRSRWTDFLSSDGEKPDRDRDSEFEIGASDTREALMTRWNTGFDIMAASLLALRPEHFEQCVLIRSEPHTVVRAVIRSVSHVTYHVGQIVQLAKHVTGDQWRTLSIARGKSREFNEKMAMTTR